MDDQRPPGVEGRLAGDAAPGEQPEHHVPEALGVGAARAVAGQVEAHQVGVGHQDRVARPHDRAQPGLPLTAVRVGGDDVGEQVVEHVVEEGDLAGHVAVERVGTHPQAGGDGPHGQRVGTLGGEQLAGDGHHAVVGEAGAFTGPAGGDHGGNCTVFC